MNRRPQPPEGQPITLKLGDLLKNFTEASIDLDGFTAKVIIRIEVIEIELHIALSEPPDLSEENHQSDERGGG